MADLWMRATCSRYNAMKNRPIVLKLGGLRFSLDEFRYHVLKFFGTRDGVGRCRYCGRHVTFESSATDHAMPLKRGGSQGLENLEFPCPQCNRIKGGLTPDEMIGYMLWKTLLPQAAQDDLDERLSKAVQALTSMGRFQRKQKAFAAKVR